MIKARSTLAEILKEFCKTTSIPACNYFVTWNSKFENLFWIIIILGGFLSTILLTRHICNNWALESVFISLDASSHPLNKVDFPGVAICNINKISKGQAIHFAEYLNRELKHENLSRILELVKLLGNLYDFDIEGAPNFPLFQDMLNTYDNITKQIDLSARLLALTTPCEDILLNCTWNSVAYDCLDFFQTRLTDSGFCCVFNYIRPVSKAFIYSSVNKVPKFPKKFIGPGLSKGLSVTINNNVNDYFYTVMATKGFLVKIFLPRDYPDLLSGSLRQGIVQDGTEAFFKIQANTLKSQNQIKSLPINLRKCKFPEEDQTVFGKYSFSDCFVDCKIRSILSLCNCVPFMMPIEHGMNKENISFCNLIDLPCLNKYQDKWSRYYPMEAEDVEELKLETHESLNCDCIPNCNDVNYDLDVNYFEYESSNNLNPNASKIYIYSNVAYTNLYKKMVTVTWYEGLSTFGGILSLMLGVSIISVVEISLLIIKLVICKLKN